MCVMFCYYFIRVPQKSITPLKHQQNITVELPNYYKATLLVGLIIVNPFNYIKILNNRIL